MGLDPDTSHPASFRFPIRSEALVFISWDSFVRLSASLGPPADIGFPDLSSSYQNQFPMFKEIICSNEIHRYLRVLNSDVCS
jgi:hypothetical protein